MRSPTTSEKVVQFMAKLGLSAKGPGRVYLTGGACAVLIGWRQATIDIDLKLDPEPEGAFAAIATLKQELDINVELSAPEDFIPPLPGWRDRSRFIARHGQIDFYHYDFYAQALSKIERSHSQDVNDVGEMLTRALVRPEKLEQLFHQIEPLIVRYPALNAEAFRDRLRVTLSKFNNG